jgi:hypothetical protein
MNKNHIPWCRDFNFSKDKLTVTLYAKLETQNCYWKMVVLSNICEVISNRQLNVPSDHKLCGRLHKFIVKEVIVT